MDIEFFKQCAREVASKEEHRPTVFFGFGDDQIASLSLVSVPNELGPSIIREAARKFSAHELVYVDEGWVVVVSKDVDPDTVAKPSVHPDRQEVLLVYHESKDGRITYIAKIESDGEKRIVGEYKKLEDGEGRLQRFLPMYDLQKS